jgi:hypothetical protein
VVHDGDAVGGHGDVGLDAGDAGGGGVQEALDGVFGRFAAGAAVAVDEQCENPSILSGEESASFFEKKEAKKLLFTAGVGASRANARRSKSFLLLFFKKEALSFLFVAFWQWSKSGAGLLHPASPGSQ